MTTSLATLEVAPPRDSPWTTMDVATLPTDPDGGDDAPDWVLPGLLERGARMLLAGDEGAGKSLLLMQFAVRLAAGVPTVPGDVWPGPLRVLVVDTELNARTARRRLRPMAEHASLQCGQLRYVLAPAGVDLLRDDELNELRRIIAGHSPHVVAIDSLYRAYNADPDDPRAGGQVQRVLDSIRADTRAALVVACHYRKRGSDGRYRRSLDDLAGSRVWKAWPETVVDVADKALRVLKDREGRAPVLALSRRGAGEWESDPHGWPFALALGERDERPAWRGHTLIQPYVLAVLASADKPLSTSRVTHLVAEDRAAEDAKPFHRSTIAAALGELETQREVRKQPGARGANDWQIAVAGLARVRRDDTDQECPTDT